jgi:hypothetical protein
MIQARKLVVNAVNLKARKPESQKARKPTNNVTIGNIATMTSIVVFINLPPVRRD